MTTFEDLANPGVASLPIYEPGRPIEEVARELGIADVASIDKLASNENELGPSPLAIAAMHESAAQMHRYPDGGCYYLRAGLARHLGIGTDQLLAGNGSNELLELLGHAFLRPGRSIVMAEHAFVVYRLVAMAAGAEIRAVPMRAFTHDLDAMLAAIDERTAVVFIGNPNNPTGTVVPPAGLARFMERVPGHVIVVFDEAYIELLPPEEQPDTLRYVREGRLAIVLRTFSKTYGLAGLRIGYGAAPTACIRLLDRVRQPFNVNAMAQAAALAALDDDAHVQRTRTLVSEGLAYLAGACQDAGFGYVPAVANFMLIEVGQGRQAFEALQRQGVIVRPMDGYGLGSYVRVTVGTRAQNERLMRALRAWREGCAA